MILQKLFYIFLSLISLHSISLRSMECEKNYAEERKRNSAVIIFGKDLSSVTLDESLLDYSRPLREKLIEQRRNVRDKITPYAPDAISTDLNSLQIDILEACLTVARDYKNIHETFINSEKIAVMQIIISKSGGSHKNDFKKHIFKCLKEFEITPLHILFANEIGQLKEKPTKTHISLHKKMIQFLHTHQQKEADNTEKQDEPEKIVLRKTLIPMRPKALHAQPNLCNLRFYNFSPKRKRHQKIIETDAFVSLPLLVLSAAKKGDNATLKQFLTPRPFSIRRKSNKRFFQHNRKNFALTAIGSEYNDRVSARTISPLLMAIEHEKLRTIKYLVEECKADTKWRDDFKNSLLHYIAKNPGRFSTERIIPYLIAYCNLDPYAYNDKGFAPLHCAVASKVIFYDRLVISYFLTKLKINPNLPTKYGRTCLHIAAKAGHYSLLKILLKTYTMDVMARDSIGNTPLHLTPLKNPNKKIVACLLKHGAQILAQNSYGKSTLHYAILLRNNELAEYIKKQIYQKNIQEKAECPICIESIESFPHRKHCILTCCGHFICSDDAKTILENNEKPLCPLCREELNQCEKITHAYLS